MIEINPSPTADTRSCDFSQVTKEQLLKSSRMHIGDIGKAMRYFQGMLWSSVINHDHDKITDIDGFHRDFSGGFKNTTWWDNHRKVNRHHLDKEDGVPEDVNLIDVLDMIADQVMAGMARKGTLYPIEIKPEVLMKAFNNTVERLKAEVIVVKDQQ